MSLTSPVPAEPRTGDELAHLITAVNGLHGRAADAALIDQISALEHLTSACAAAQHRLTHAFAVSRTVDGAHRNLDPDRTRLSVAGQIALARRQSRSNGRRLVGMAAALVTEMPCTLAALESVRFRSGGPGP